MPFLKFRITIMQFLEFFIWGTWLISFSAYLMFGPMSATGPQIGAIFATAGLASLITPGLVGIISDKWVNSERMLGICHLMGASVLFFASKATTYEELFPLMLINAMVFMPTISLSYSVSYSLLGKAELDPVKSFPPIRTWGTVGFIAAMFIVDFMGWSISPNQLKLASVSSLLLGIYSFTLPPSKPMKSFGKSSWKSAFGLDALVLFKQRKMRMFFIFAFLLGICLQITNSFGSSFIMGFRDNDIYRDSFALQHSNIFLSISQISEALFILVIPFFLRRFGIKTVILISFAAWVLRFGLFGVGNPGNGLVWLTLSMIVYGVAFDFFNISGSLFIENEAPVHIRASSQGLLMMASNGLGAILGNIGAGYVVDYYTCDGIRDWQSIWLVFAAYALVIGIAFAALFRYKHEQGGKQ